MTEMFVSFQSAFQQLMIAVIDSPRLHKKWLNTLSYLENCGARKIAACEHPTLVKEEVLKHAAEEFRHAHYLKRQISRISTPSFPDYSLPYILGGIQSLHYLHALEASTVRQLHALCIPEESIKAYAYALVTYAIELRAKELYPLYDQLLRSAKSSVTVRSIYLEEVEHLKEIEVALNALPDGHTIAREIIRYESALCCNWIHALAIEIKHDSRSEPG